MLIAAFFLITPTTGTYCGREVDKQTVIHSDNGRQLNIKRDGLLIHTTA